MYLLLPYLAICVYLVLFLAFLASLAFLTIRASLAFLTIRASLAFLASKAVLVYSFVFYACVLDKEMETSHDLK